MQNKLSQEQIEEINKEYHDHPLLIACRQTFECYDANMRQLLFVPEEIFLEALIIIDNILADQHSAEGYISKLWNGLKIKIRHSSQGAPQDDLNMISGAILYIVAAALCQHSRVFYNENLKEKILTEVRNNMKVEKAEEFRIIENLSRCADGLYEWFSSYECGEIKLSDEILNGKNKKETNPIDDEQSDGQMAGVENPSTKVELNYFAPTQRLKDFLKQDWFKKLRSKEEFDETWIDTFVSALMQSEWRDYIAADWAVEGKRSKKTQIKGNIVGLLNDAGILKGNYNIIATSLKVDIKPKKKKKYMSDGKKQPYADWVKDYLKDM